MVAENGKLGNSFLYFYPLVYVWRSTPVVIIGILAAIFGLLAKYRPFDHPTTRFTLLGLLFFTVLFTLAMTVGTNKFDRYLLPIFAPLDIIAALGWVATVGWLNNQKFVALSRYLTPLVLSVIIGVQIFLSLSTFPYYLTYYNPMMGGSRKAPEVMQIGWGEGLDQAARYLNQKKDAEHLHIISWYSLGSFSYLSSGHVRFMGYESELDEEQWDRFISSDFAEIYIHQWQRGIPKDILEYLAKQQPEHSIWINGIEYARIYNLR